MPVIGVASYSYVVLYGPKKIIIGYIYNNNVHIHIYYVRIVLIVTNDIVVLDLCNHLFDTFNFYPYL